MLSVVDVSEHLRHHMRLNTSEKREVACGALTSATSTVLPSEPLLNIILVSTWRPVLYLLVRRPRSQRLRLVYRIPKSLKQRCRSGWLFRGISAGQLILLMVYLLLDYH